MRTDHKMKITQIIFFLLLYCFAFGQNTKAKINWADLNGKWECTKVVLIQKGDSINESNQYLPYFENYFTDLKYTEEYPASNTSTVGTYSVDKSKNIIKYKNLVMTVKYPGGKVAVADNVFKTGKQDLTVMRLTKDKLVLFERQSVNSEVQGDSIFYMKKVL